MQKNILQKCIEELKKPTCRIDYVVGMLETLVEMDGQPPASVPYTLPYVQPMNPLTPNYPIYSAIATAQNLSDEERTAQIYERGPVGNVGTV